MDTIAFSTHLDSCSPTGADRRTITELVAKASGFEPLALSFDGPRTTAIVNMTKADAVDLTRELVISGHRVRVGLAGIDTRDLDRLGVPLNDAFEPCPNLRAAAQLLARHRYDSEPTVRAELRSHMPASSEIAREPDRATPVDLPTTMANEPKFTNQSRRSWDIYGQSRGHSALIYDTSK